MNSLQFAVAVLGSPSGIGLQTTLTDLFLGTMYEITVSAINGAGEGENSVIQVETLIGNLFYIAFSHQLNVIAFSSAYSST